MNENLLMLLKTLLSDEKLAFRFAENKTLDEFFKFCSSVVSGYTKEELDEFLRQLASLSGCEEYNKITLEEELEKISGGNYMKQTNAKILAGAMAIVSLISPLSGLNQNVQADSQVVMKEQNSKKESLVVDQVAGCGIAAAAIMLGLFTLTSKNAGYVPSPGGIPNLGSSCYISSAIQQLYSIDAFSKYISSNSGIFGIGGVAWAKAIGRIFKTMDKSIKMGELITPEEIEGPLRDLGYNNSQEDITEFIQRQIINTIATDNALVNFFTLPLKIYGRTGGVTLDEVLRTGGEIDRRRTAEMRRDIRAWDNTLPGYDTLDDSTDADRSQRTRWEQKQTEFLDRPENTYKYNTPVVLQPVKGQVGILLNRTSANGKVTTRVQIPSTLTFPGRYFGNTQYELTGATVHQGGSMNSGHYYSYKRERVKGGGGKWKCYNDRSISDVTNLGSMQADIEHNGVILVYSQIK